MNRLLQLDRLDTELATNSHDTPLALALRMGDQTILRMFLYSQKIDTNWQSYTESYAPPVAPSWAEEPFEYWPRLAARLKKSNRQPTVEELLDRCVSLHRDGAIARRSHPAMLP